MRSWRCCSIWASSSTTWRTARSTRRAVCTVPTFRRLHTSPSAWRRVCARRSVRRELSRRSISRSPSARETRPSRMCLSTCAFCCSMAVARSSSKHGAEVFLRRSRLMRSLYCRTTICVAASLVGVFCSRIWRMTRLRISICAAFTACSSCSPACSFGASSGTTKFANNNVHRMTPDAKKIRLSR